jgi:AraC-like DNA-binding protein
MAGLATVQANSFHKVLEAARSVGLDPDELLRHVGVDRRALDEPDARVPFRHLVALYELAAERARDEAFGLRVGAATDPSMFDVLGHATLACPTLGAAIDTVARYLRVLQEGAAIAVAVEGSLARVSYTIHDRGAGPHRQETEATLAIALRFIRVLTGREVRPVEVRFAHASPTDDREHRRFFAAPLRFRARASEIVIDRALLDAPVVRADSKLSAILERQLRHTLAAMPPEDDLEQRLRTELPLALERSRFELSVLARTIGMSARTLQRRLEEKGVQYSTVVTDVRRERAKSLLADRRMGAGDVAFLLGYADVGAFHRAFKRWTGVTPAAWRRAARSA